MLSQQGITIAYNNCGRCCQVYHRIFDMVNKAEKGTPISIEMHEPALCEIHGDYTPPNWNNTYWFYNKKMAF